MLRKPNFEQPTEHKDKEMTQSDDTEQVVLSSEELFSGLNLYLSHTTRKF